MNNVKKMYKITAFCLVALICFYSSGKAQGQVSLQIGDSVPALKYSKWLKGAPVDITQGDKIYVVEFWATWCGPCIAAMPHLSELAEKYKDKAVFIGCNVLELAKDEKANKNYESVLPKVERFVNGSSNRMRYNVIVDNNTQDMNNNWLKPAAISGIPATFVIQKGKIAWIGHPNKIDSVVSGLLDGTFSVENYKKIHGGAAQREAKMIQDVNDIMDSIKTAVAANKFNEAFKIIDEAPKRMPMLKYAMPREKFKILLQHVDEKRAIEYAKELINKDKYFSAVVGQTITEIDGLQPSTYQYGIENLQQLKPVNALLLDLIATGYAKANNFAAAAETQQKAIEMAREHLKDPQYASRIFDYTITDYQKKLDEYKKNIKK